MQDTSALYHHGTVLHQQHLNKSDIPHRPTIYFELA